MKSLFRKPAGGEAGINLIEMLIAVAILGAIGVTFMSAYNTSNVSVGILEQKTRGMQLAMDHVDYLRDAEFATDYSDIFAGINMPSQFERNITLEYSSDGENWTDTYSAQTLQRIVISISQGGEPVYSLCTFKWQ
jgi:type II secretory pathway pseudopilin PulG